MGCRWLLFLLTNTLAPMQCPRWQRRAVRCCALHNAEAGKAEQLRIFLSGSLLELASAWQGISRSEQRSECITRRFVEPSHLSAIRTTTYPASHRLQHSKMTRRPHRQLALLLGACWVASVSRGCCLTRLRAMKRKGKWSLTCSGSAMCLAVRCSSGCHIALLCLSEGLAQKERRAC
jgi:hypothetical protein